MGGRRHVDCSNRNGLKTSFSSATGTSSVGLVWVRSPSTCTSHARLPSSFLLFWTCSTPFCHSSASRAIREGVDVAQQVRRTVRRRHTTNDGEMIAPHPALGSKGDATWVRKGRFDRDSKEIQRGERMLLGPRPNDAESTRVDKSTEPHQLVVDDTKDAEPIHGMRTTVPQPNHRLVCKENDVPRMSQKTFQPIPKRSEMCQPCRHKSVPCAPGGKKGPRRVNVPSHCNASRPTYKIFQTVAVSRCLKYYARPNHNIATLYIFLNKDGVRANLQPYTRFCH